MYVIREVLHCKPGKVRPMVDKFKTISGVLTEMGQGPLRLLTDVSGEPFWTIVAEATVEKIEDFFSMEQTLMANDTLRKSDGRLPRARGERPPRNLSTRELNPSVGVVSGIAA